MVQAYNRKNVQLGTSTTITTKDFSEFVLVPRTYPNMNMFIRGQYIVDICAHSQKKEVEGDVHLQ